MRRFSFLFAAILLSLSSNLNAQFVKGTRMTGASIASVFMSSGSSDQTVASIGSASGKENSYGINIIPSMGWFVADNTAVGFSFLINPYGNKVTFEQNGSVYQKDKSDYFNIGLGGFVRSYFRHSGSLLPFGELNVNGGIANLKKSGFFYGGGTGPTSYKETYDGKSTGGFFAQAFFTAGVTKMVGQYTGVDLYFSYNFYYSKNTTKTTRLKDVMIDGTIDETLKNETTTRFTNNKFTIGLGFQIFLQKKK